MVFPENVRSFICTFDSMAKLAQSWAHLRRSRFFGSIPTERQTLSSWSWLVPKVAWTLRQFVPYRSGKNGIVDRFHLKLALQLRQWNTHFQGWIPLTGDLKLNQNRTFPQHWDMKVREKEEEREEGLAAKGAPAKRIEGGAQTVGGLRRPPLYIMFVSYVKPLYKGKELAS